MWRIILLLSISQVFLVVFAKDDCLLDELWHHSKPVMMASPERLALVNISAYIDFLEEPAGFLELNLERVTYGPNIWHPTANNERILSLAFDCATIDFHMVVESDVYAINHVSLTTGMIGSRRQVISCTNAGFQTSQSMTDRVSCVGTIINGCYIMSTDTIGNKYFKPVAQIVFDTLEIEIRSDTKKDHSKELIDGFTAPPDSDSCLNFSRDIKPVADH